MLAEIIKQNRLVIERNEGVPSNLFIKISRNGKIQVISEPMDLDFYFNIINRLIPRPDYKLIIKGVFDGEAKSFEIKLPSEESLSAGIRRLTLGFSDYHIYLVNVLWDDGDAMYYDNKTLVINTRKPDKLFFVLASLFPYVEIDEDTKEVCFKVECTEEKELTKAKLTIEKDGKQVGVKVGYSKTS